MFRLLFRAVAAMLISTNSFSQTVLTEIETGASYNEFKGVALSGDSILVVYKPSSFGVNGALQSLWISPEGEQHRISFDSVDFRAIIDVATDNDVEWYYYLVRSEDKQVLKAATRRKDDGTWRIEKEEVEMPGLLLANHYDDGILHLICMDPKQTDLKTLAVKDLTVTDQKTYTLHAPLSKKKRTSVTIVTPQRPLAPEETLAAIKLYWTPELLTIIKDDPFDEYDHSQTSYKTDVYRINLETGSVDHKFYKEETRSVFFSIHFQDHLYRVVGFREQMRIEVFDMRTGRRRNSVYLNPIKSDKKNFAYYADGHADKVEKVKIKKAMKTINYLVAGPASDGIVLRMGSRYGIVPGIIFINPTLAKFLIAVAVNVALAQIPVPVTEDYFFYLYGSPDKGFAFSKTPTSVSQRVTEYGLEMTEKGERYLQKVHLYGPDFIYGLYIPKKSTKIQILKFTEP